MSISKRKAKGKAQYRFVVSYKAPDGSYKQKASRWYATATEAKKAETAFRRDELPLLLSTSETFGFYAEEMMRWKETQIVYHTQRQYRAMLDHHLKDLYPLKLEAITTEDLNRVFSKPSFARLATNSKNTCRVVCGEVFRYARAYHGKMSTAMDRIPVFKKTESERLREMQVLTPDQFDLFMKALKNGKESSYMQGLFYVLYWTGMRFNEAASLTFKDVHPDHIMLTRQYDQERKAWTTLKTKKPRRIAIDKDLYQVFIDLRAEYMKEFPAEFNDSWFCFGGYKPISNPRARSAKNKALRREKSLPAFRIHDLRHSHASYLIEKGVNIYKISQRLGHSSISMTLDRYGHLLDQNGDEILGAIKNKTPGKV